MRPAGPWHEKVPDRGNLEGTVIRLCFDDEIQRRRG